MISQNKLNIFIASVGFALSMVGIGIDKIFPNVSGYWFLIPGIILFIIGVVGIIRALYLKNNDKYQAILVEIEKSRKEAAALQIEGMQLSDERALNYWIERVNAWYEAIYDKLLEFNPGEAGKFETLGLFSVQLAVGTKILNPKHESTLRKLIRRMQILDDIREHWVKLI